MKLSFTWRIYNLLDLKYFLAYLGSNVKTTNESQYARRLHLSISCRPLSYPVLNQWISSGISPKLHLELPLFLQKKKKKGTRKNVNNYWPISMIPAVVKIFGKVILTINSASTWLVPSRLSLSLVSGARGVMGRTRALPEDDWGRVSASTLTTMIFQKNSRSVLDNLLDNSIALLRSRPVSLLIQITVLILMMVRHTL